MDRFELPPELAAEIRERVFGDGFIKIVQTVRRGGTVFKISMRPVELGGARKFQAEMTDRGQVQVKNFSAGAAAEGLEEIIAQRGARELHLITTTGDLHLRVTKKGKVLSSRSAPLVREAPPATHDKVKKLPLESFDASAILRVTGIADADGRIKPSMRGKYDQVNSFLADPLIAGLAESKRVAIVDCGCGKAYLTLALYGYLAHVLGEGRVRVAGVDRRADVIAAAREMAKRLDWDESKAFFVESDLASFEFERAPDEDVMVVSLHACDTATDEALAKAVEWRAKWILSAPCCQHELQKTITGPNSNNVFAGLLRQNILRERLCDILTDSFRALILRMLGYKTQVVGFVSPERTGRNILLRAESGQKSAQTQCASEYLALRDFWKATPWLEERLSKQLSPILEKFT